MTEELKEDVTTIVREFLAAMEVNAVDEAMDLVTDDIAWRNSSLPTVHGAKRLRAMLEQMVARRIRFRADFHHIAADGNIVLTDRTDYLAIGPVESSFWVCGTFEIRDGKIAVWDDHFSWENLLRGTVKGLFRAVVPGQ